MCVMCGVFECPCISAESCCFFVVFLVGLMSFFSKGKEMEKIDNEVFSFFFFFFSPCFKWSLVYFTSRPWCIVTWSLLTSLGLVSFQTTSGVFSSAILEDLREKKKEKKEKTKQKKTIKTKRKRNGWGCPQSAGKSG